MAPVFIMIGLTLVILGLLCFIVWGKTRQSRTSLRLLFRTFSLALIIAPSLLIEVDEGGAGAFPVPAFVVFVVSLLGADFKTMFYFFVIPVLSVWALSFVLSWLYVKLIKGT